VLLNPDRPDRLIRGLDMSGFIKRPVSATTRSNLVDPAGQPVTRVRTDQDQVFFFKCGFWNPSVYILYVYKKKIMFFQYAIWNLLVYIFYVPKKKVIFFQCGIWNPLVYIIYVHKKKAMFFQCRIRNFFDLNTSA
jgi:hypothetical protein